MPADLMAWAARIRGPDGDVTLHELVGVGVGAATYPSLLWNGARLHRADAPAADGLVLVALTCGATAGSARLDDAVTAGLAALETGQAAGPAGARRRTPSSEVRTAQVTSAVVAAAVCAATASGAESATRGVRDLAGSLMVVRPPTVAVATQASVSVSDGLAAGHALAAGWLATVLDTAGVVGVPDAFERALHAVEGTP